MPRQRKDDSPATRRSSRSPAAVKPTASQAVPKETPVAKKTKIADEVKAKPGESDAELSSPTLKVTSSRKTKPVGSKASGKEIDNGKEKQNDEADIPESKMPKTPKTSKEVKEDVTKEEGLLPSPPAAPRQSKRKIIIEACTQCRSFRERADKVKNGLESAIPGISVEINPDKPRRGYFEIREEKTQVFLSLPSMNRPFTLMKKLDMDEVVNDLVNQCK